MDLTFEIIFMKQSQLFTKTQREAGGDDTSAGTRLLLRAGFVDRSAAGIYAMLPLGFLVLQNIEKVIADKMDALGAQRILLPALTPKKNWETTGRWNGLDILYKIKSRQDAEYALGATHEEMITPLAQKFALSYKDFPFAAYQIQTKFRDELRAKSGLLRGREFLMKDLYSFHIDPKDSDGHYEKIKEAYFEMFNAAGIGHATHLTLASGGTFSKFSHEFQTATAAGEDEIYHCAACGFTINREIKQDYPQCPECGGAEFNQEKAIEVGNIFKLGDKYSAAFEFFAVGESGQNLPVLMNCYGIGLTRLMGAIAELSRDGAGLIWPKTIAPFLVHLLELESKDAATNKKIKEICLKIRQDWQKRQIGVLYDDRQGKSAGEKFNDADLIGIPWRAVASAKTIEKDSVEIKKRDEKEAKLVKLKEISDYEF